MSWIAAGIAGGSALLKFGQGAIQSHQANQIDKNNPYPNMPVQQEYQQNVDEAAQMARVGMPRQQYENQMNSIQRNQAGGLQQLGNSANPGANLASIVRAGNDATGNLNAQDAVQRNRNMLNLLQQRQILAQQKDKAWDWNSQQKYLGLLAKSQALKGAGMQNMTNAFNDVGSGAGTLMKMGAGQSGITRGDEINDMSTMLSDFNNGTNGNLDQNY